MKNSSDVGKGDIEMDADTIWLLLMDRGSLNIEEIGELTNFREPAIYLALGWLSRENEVRFSDKHEMLYVELNHSISEMCFEK